MQCLSAHLLFTTAEIDTLLNGFIHRFNLSGSDGDEAGEGKELEEADHGWQAVCIGQWVGRNYVAANEERVAGSLE